MTQSSEPEGTVEAAAETPAKAAARKPGLWLIGALLVLAVVAGGLYTYRYSVSGPVVEALRGETGAEIAVYRRSWFGGSEIVFDLKSVDGGISPLDITRRFLKSGEALKDSRFERVYLAYRGREKFYLKGNDFQQLGKEYAYQNPVYTIRTLPEKVLNLDGTPAFGSWTGGWLGVLGKQMEDANELHRRWWMNDAIRDI